MLLIAPKRRHGETYNSQNFATAIPFLAQTYTENIFTQPTLINLPNLLHILTPAASI